MTQRKEDKELKKLFQQGLEQAPDGFTGKLMDHIEAEERLTAGIVQQAGTEAAPAHFTHNIMQQLGVEQATTLTPYKPVISWKGWVGIAAVLGVIIGWVIRESPESTFTPPDWANNWQQMLPTDVSIPSFVVMGLAAVLVLLLAEQLIRRATLNRRIS